MISPTLDKKEYFEAMKVDADSNGTDANFLRRRQANENFEFKSLLIKSQWSYVKKQLDNNESPRTLIERGDLYLLRGNYKRAVDYYQKSLISDENHIPAYEKIINAYCKHNKHPLAHPYYKQLLKVTGNRSSLFRKYVSYRVDLLFLHDGNIQNTLHIINQSLENNPIDCELINTIGFIKLNLEQDLARAEEYFDKALEIDSNYIHSVNNKGICQLRTERLEEAEAAFKKCITINPNSYPFSYQNLSFLYVNQDRLDDALNILQNAKENGVKLDEPRIHLEGWLLMQLNRYEEAVIWYEAKIKEEPTNQFLLNNLGFCYMRLQMPELGEQRFKLAVKISEDKISKTKKLDKRAIKAYYNLARVAISKRDHDETKRIADRISQINKDDAFAYYLKGVVYGGDEQYSEAQLAYEKALELNDLIPEVYPDLAFILNSVNHDYVSAITLLEKAIHLGFRTALIMNNLAFSYIKNGDLDKAESILNTLKEQSELPLPPVLMATNGLLEFRKGNIESGNALYDLAKENFVDKKNMRIASQIQALENAKYCLDNSDYENAAIHLAEARKFPKSYLDTQINDFEIELGSKQDS